MSDSPDYTQRELAQRLLIDRIEEILTKTGRVNGFPGSDVTAAALNKTGQTRAGPPPVLISRVVRDGRSSNGNLYDADPDGYEPQTLMNAFVPKQNLDFLEMPTPTLDLVRPKVLLYKSYPADTGGDTFDVLFRNEWLKQPKTPRSKDIRTGLTGLSIERMGENPALVDSNIKVQLTIETQDLNNLFYRYRPHEFDAKKDANGTPLPGTLSSAGIAWIDLIKMNPAQAIDNNKCDLSYNAAESTIKLVIGYNKVSNNVLLSNAKKASREGKPIYTLDAHGHTQVDDEFFEKNPMTQARQEAFLRTATNNEATIDEKGIEQFNENLKKSRNPKLRAARSQEAIQNQTEIFYLQLKNHDLIIADDLSVKLTINFVGRTEVMQRTPDADLLSDPEVRGLLAELTAKSDAVTDNLGDVQTEDEPETETEKEKKARLIANKDREACRTKFEGELETLEKEYNKMYLVAKKRLYNQLLLRSTDEARSRIYKVRIPDHLDLRPSRRGAKAFAGDPAHEQYRYPLLIANHHEGFSESGGVGASEDLSELHNAQEMNNKADDKTAKSASDLMNQDLPSNENYKQINFVFIGDILEAALEIVAYNNGFSGKRISSQVALTALEEDKAARIAAGIPVQNYNPQLALTRDVKDNAPVPTFHKELQKDGSLGPAARATQTLLGQYAFGDIELPIRNSDNTTRYVNIADIPIDLEQFRTFWFNQVNSKPQYTSFFIKNLINGILTNLIPYAIKSRAVVSRSQGVQKPATVQLSYFSLPNYAYVLNNKVQTKTVPLEQPISDQASRTPESEAPGETLVDKDGNPVTLSDDEAYAQTSEFTPEEMQPGESDPTQQVVIKYSPYRRSDEISALLSNAAQTTKSTQTYEMLLIQQKPAGTIQRSGHRTKDYKKGIVHFSMNVAQKKALLSVQFKRQDLPMIQAHNLITDNEFNSLGILREKYDATLITRGNTVFKPGTVLYLNPKNLQGTPLSIPEEKNTRRLKSGLRTSAARALGLGGYFVVTQVKHDFGDLAKNAKWTTTLETKWLSFEHIEGLEEGCQKSVSTASTSPGASQCLIEAEEDRLEAATAIAEAEAARSAHGAAAAAHANVVGTYSTSGRKI